MTDTCTDRDWLRGRRWTIGDVAPVRFPAWRMWVDSRVRMDDAVLDLLAGMDLAVVALNERSRTDDDIVPDIFASDELPYGRGFSVTVGVARRRLREAEDQAVLMALPTYVAGFDRLLGAVIQLLRRVRIDTVDPSVADTGLSSKLKHLSNVSAVRLEPQNQALWRLLLAVRNSVVHHASSQRPVFAAWEACANEKSEMNAQAMWTRLAERPLPVRDTDDRLAFSDREVVGAQRVLDGIAIDLAAKLRNRISPVDWARLVAAEEGPKHPGILTNPPIPPETYASWWHGRITGGDWRSTRRPRCVR
jgi:hypothetical protein